MSSRFMIGGLRADLHLDAIADAPRKTGFRLDIGVFDEARFEFALDDGRRPMPSRLHIAVRPRGRGSGCCRAGSAWTRRRLSAIADSMLSRAGNSSHVDREARQIERLDRSMLADDSGHGLATETRLASAKTGWSAKGGMTP